MNTIKSHTKSLGFIATSVVGLCVASAAVKRSARLTLTRNDDVSSSGKKDAVPVINNKKFRKQILKLIRIVLPTWYCREAGILCVHTLLLFARTFLSLYVAWLDGALVKALVARQLDYFVHLMIRWMVVAVPASLCNSLIKFFESTLATSFRARLTEYSMQKYMDREVYYRVINMDDRVNNADQRLTEDVSNFCNNLAHVHSQLSKPFLDVVLSTVNLLAIGRTADLRRGASTSAAVVAGITIWASATFLRLARPPLGALVAREAALEGHLRYVHARVIGNAEQIGFYRGQRVEHAHLLDAFDALREHQQRAHWTRLPFGVVESFLMKYVWSGAGLIMLAVPAFVFERAQSPTADAAELMSGRTGDFVTARKLLVTSSDAIERMLLAIKEVSQLAGYASRVSDALDVFDDVARGQYVKRATIETDAAVFVAGATLSSEQRNSSMKSSILSSRGKMELCDNEISFESVPIVSPNGDILIAAMSFRVARGEHLLIAGPNGCGKSSLFRILGGLWPAHGGIVRKPAFEQMFYIPQQPYMTLGSLRDQIIYPDRLSDMQAKRRTDEELFDILRRAHCLHVAQREADGLDAVRDWKSALSGGLLQRVGLARVLYHRPAFAILDECTSAVSIDVEGAMYQDMIDSGITLLTVTHRPSLWRYHKHLLQFDGEGGFLFRKLDTQVDVVQTLAAQRDAVQTQIRELQSKLSELNAELTTVDD